jgi:putative tryptophan/tyrosine transport system substrate-binding protein
MRRRDFIAATGLAAASALGAHAQEASKVRFILWVSTEAQPDPFIAAFRDAMRARGYVEGQNIAFVLRYAPGDPAALRAMLSDILETPADLIVSSGPAILAMRAATDKPVLFAISGDPVALGIAQSLSRPGRNFTGSTFLSLDVAQKRVQLVRELVPEVQTLAVLSQKNHPGEPSEYEATQKAAEALGVHIAYVPFASGAQIDDALERVRAAAAHAMLVFPDGVTMVHRAKIAEFAKAQRLPSMFGWREYCDAGGLASYGASQRATYARLAVYAERILKGEKPADLPVEQPTKFELVLNVKAAKAINLSIPPTLLARADEVIE